MVTISNILFVCTGNTCRSPLAEGMCRMMAKREGIPLQVRSAGVSAADGSAYSRHSSDILRAKGVLEGMKGSSYLREEQIRWADLILTMTMSHKRVVIGEHPEAVDKVFTLKEFVEDGPAALRAFAEREELVSELALKQALGQPVTQSEREKLAQLQWKVPNYDINDPFGGSRAEYDAVADEIEQAVTKLLRKIRTQQ